MKILIYGGTFNPVHLAHIENINLACHTFSFDKILIIPNKNGHFKENDELASIEDRLKMVDLALKKLNKNIDVEISRIEIDSENNLYSNDVVDCLINKYKNAEFYFLIGSDQARNIDKWYKIAELKKKVKFIVTKRDENYCDDEFLTINNDIMPYSSTAIRERYATSGIEDVDKYIREHGLYLEIVLKRYLNDKRLQHSINVASLAKEKASKYQIDSSKAYVAGMLHDIGKEINITKQYELIESDDNLFEISDATIHALSGYYIAKNDLGINDEEVLNAIKWHTTAYYEMSDLDKLIYVCDMLSQERDFIGVEKLRDLLDKDLNECFKACFIASYNHLLKKGINISDELNKLKEMIERNEV
ncbi:nicotinate-nucleotide adenylyltransferase [Bacilli bacterium PM5-3]|nr:nicotinate-nucleotide adenylyltransferase [Bacilli bacterium PM5-3]MDH6603948.1 nicotinate-nucleotide adenylyltransferase [Bacilli bacterium PM5-9]